MVLRIIMGEISIIYSVAINTIADSLLCRECCRGDLRTVREVQRWPSSHTDAVVAIAHWQGRDSLQQASAESDHTSQLVGLHHLIRKYINTLHTWRRGGRLEPSAPDRNMPHTHTLGTHTNHYSSQWHMGLYTRLGNVSCFEEPPHGTSWVPVYKQHPRTGQQPWQETKHPQIIVDEVWYSVQNAEWLIIVIARCRHIKVQLKRFSTGATRCAFLRTS